jgi:uncharacterized protein (TIGR01777 family)
MSIVIAGGSGMLGRALARSLVDDGVDVVVLTRDADMPPVTPGIRQVRWDGRTIEGGWAQELAHADAVVDLCGLSVGTWPWTAGTRARLRSSRLEPRNALVQAMHELQPGERPQAFVAISGTDGYVGSDAEPATEDTPLADTFLGGLCRDWEAAAAPAAGLGVRLVIARTCVIVGPGAPALERLALPVRLFAGGRIGSGRQWFSWIHITDWVAAVRLVLRDATITGPINLAGPTPLSQVEVVRALGRILHRPSVVPTPAFAIRLVLGGQADLVLGSRRVSSARLERVGMTFAWPDFEAAARDALG